jgi:hypothetical protein
MRALVLPVAALTLVPLRGHAATFVVDGAGETGDATPGDSSCDTGAGQCTLVAAMRS